LCQTAHEFATPILNATIYPGTLSTITCSFRAGRETAYPCYFNGDGGARIYGGAMNSNLIIEEVMA
jgi:hypothetical protein